MVTTYMCGNAGCLTQGVALVAAILTLLLIGWIYVTWQDWAVKYLEEVERDIRRTRWLREMEESELDRSDENVLQ
jgi:hypothetical protein